MKMHHAILAALAFAGAVHAQSPRRTPEKAAAEFYVARIAAKIDGLPDEAQLAAIAPRLTPELKQLFVEARVTQLVFKKKQPQEKPPWAEGDLFSSLFEGTHTHKTGVAEVKGDRAEVPVALTWNERGNVTRWSDTLVLRRIEGRWLLDDIIMKGDWAFKNGASLRKTLTMPVE